MGRPKNLVPSYHLMVAIPLPLFTRVTAQLYSELEGRVPLGSYSNLFTNLLNQHFSGESLDLSPYLPETLPGQNIVSAPPSTIATLRRLLESPRHE